MKRSTERILTTHAGSLVRPPEIIAVLKAEAFGEPYDQEAFTRHLRTAVTDVVRRQAEVGIDIPSDGEFGKVSWNNYVLERFSGLELRELPPGATPLGRGKDRRDFADFYAVWNQVERTIWLPPEVAQAVPATGALTALGVHRSHRLQGARRHPAGHRQLQGSAGRGGRGRGLPARGRARQRGGVAPQ